MEQLITMLDSGKIFQNSKKLIEALLKLNNLVGMEKCKQSIIDQVKFLLLEERFSELGSASKTMLHTLIFGPPGTGKTELGRTLSEIWIAIKEVRERRQEEQALEMHDEIQIYVDSIHNSAARQENELESLQSTVFSNKRKYSQMLKANVDKVVDIHQEIDQTLDNLDRLLRRKYRQLNPTSKKAETLFKVVSRKDLVAEYMGQTAIKTKKVIESAIGGVLFIDEAYSLFQDDKDSFGKEAIAVIIQYMTEFPDKVIFIFAGYKNEMLDTVFTANPGMKRRFSWVFEIDGYNNKELSDIFLLQLKRDEWECDCDKQTLDAFFSKHKKKFPFYGGDTERFVFQCKLTFAREAFEKFNVVTKRSIGIEIMEKAIPHFQTNHLDSHKVSSEPPLGMYI
jgi:SpoVK/Ycf46/Vps4 family AAA+-type ATPase